MRLTPAQEVGLRLRAVRKHMNLSQVAFARDVCHCTQAFISAIELGKSAPSVPLLSSLELFNISASWLLTGLGSLLRSPSLESLESLSSLPASVRDAPCSLPQSSILIPLPPDVQAGDTILVKIERREHPLALIGKIIYTVPRK